MVTSSDLVRHFGLWQERATRAPLYILHRGRPRFVMTTVETMDILCAPHVEEGAGEAKTRAQIDPTALLDGVGDVVLVADESGMVVSSSRAARAHFGPLAASGRPVDAISLGSTRAFLVDAVRRVIASGIGERLDIPSSARAGRTLALAIEPAGRGVMLFARDGTTERDHAVARAADDALEAAMLATTGIARATVNARGYVVDPSAALATMTGLTRPALAMIRFVALADIGARVALGAAIERALAGEAPPALAARLLVNRADPVAVRIGLAPLRSGATVEGAVALIVAP